MLQAIDQFIKGAIVIIYQIVLPCRKIEIIRKTNKGLNKYRRGKKTRVRLRGTLIVQDTEDILDQRDINNQIAQEIRQDNCFVKGTRTKI
jgi:hypothetical protein